MSLDEFLRVRVRQMIVEELDSREDVLAVLKRRRIEQSS